ncbi:hypothetical protein [Ruminococcus flavefaciens]|uniref:Uncharacterized protein n=1 Tax=Ruminococcus flavefaciens TaxID=1265 RepID=A0A315Y4F0_RUMFL|nr:hypothetical protein [Ruminococcus flavefaciens]PWJ14669.1 hypothetical protein IE37_00654 [Ruminococcus flavefaciens]SSA42699.1 hypothetical protein SAMN02910325_00654 [Ruminococcus flavefaciens]
MAFTILGFGTAIAKTVNPKSVTTLSAHAACNHVVDSSALSNDRYKPKWKYEHTENQCDIYKMPIKCVRCGKTLWYRYKGKFWRINIGYTPNNLPYTWKTYIKIKYSTDKEKVSEL